MMEVGAYFEVEWNRNQKEPKIKLYGTKNRISEAIEFFKHSGFHLGSTVLGGELINGKYKDFNNKLRSPLQRILASMVTKNT